MWARGAGWREGISRERRNEEEVEAGRKQGSGDGGLIAATGIEMGIRRSGVASATTREDHIGGTTESDRASAITGIVTRGLEATRGVGLLPILNILGGHYKSGAIPPDLLVTTRGPEIVTPHNDSAIWRDLEMDIPHSYPAVGGGLKIGIPLDPSVTGRIPQIETATVTVGDDLKNTLNSIPRINCTNPLDSPLPSLPFLSTFLLVLFSCFLGVQGLQSSPFCVYNHPLIIFFLRFLSF